MKLKYLLLAAPVFLGYGSLTHAATKGFDHDYSHSSSHFEHHGDFGHHGNFRHHGFFEHHEKQDHKWYHDDNKYDFKDHIKALIKNHHDHNVFLRLCKKDQDDHVDGHDGGHGHGNRFGHGGHHGHGNHYGHGGNWGHDSGNWDPGTAPDPNGNGAGTGGAVSEVPVPAAVWLFGPSLIGLLGIKRKKA